MQKAHTNLQTGENAGELCSEAKGLQHKNQHRNSQGIEERQGHKNADRSNDATRRQEGNKEEQHHKLEEEKRWQRVDSFQVACLLNLLHLLAASNSKSALFQ